MLNKNKSFWWKCRCNLSSSYSRFCVFLFQDISTELSGVGLSADRAKAVDFTAPILETYISAMTKTQPKGDFFVSEPHPYSVYLSYAAMAVVVTGAVYMFENVMYKTQVHFHNYIPCRLFTALWMVVCIMLKQGIISHTRLWIVPSCRLTFTWVLLWCIFARCNFSAHAISSKRMTEGGMNKMMYISQMILYKKHCANLFYVDQIII